LSVQSAMACVDESDAWSVLSASLSGDAVGAGSAVATSVVTDLLDRFSQIADYRRQPWVEHPLAAVLALCAGAVVAGMCSFTAVAGWVGDVSEDVLASVYARCGHVGPAKAPSKCTLWHVLTRTPAAPVDAAVGAWLLERAGALMSYRPPQGDQQRADPEPGAGEPARLVPIAGAACLAGLAVDAWRTRRRRSKANTRRARSGFGFRSATLNRSERTHMDPTAEQATQPHAAVLAVHVALRVRLHDPIVRPRSAPRQDCRRRPPHACAAGAEMGLVR
jgi:hypothetical protein